MSRPLRVAVIGSGPSGMYAADALAAQGGIEIDVVDRLPVPFGLVRYGVAPDHLSIRSVRDTLDKVLDKPEVRFLGNVEVGRDISVAQLHEFYDAIIWTYGASLDRRLGIEGEELAGSIAATDLVAWYCGHPDADRAAFEELLPTIRSVAVIGVGNVAVDVTRVLAKTAPELDHTDMPQHVLDTLAKSQVREVHLIGRRGPAQATFTTKELRELGELADADVVVDAADLELDPASEAAIAADKAVARNIEVLREWSTRTPQGRGRTIHLHFLARPVRILGTERVAAIEVERTRLDERGSAVGTGEFASIPVDAVVRSIGYRGAQLPSVPFDAGGNVIPHLEGRVVRDGAPVVGEYVAGWIKRGPTGIIGTNKKDATATVASLLADADSLPRAPFGTADAVDAWLAEAGVSVVRTEGWRAIDRAERELGASAGRDRTTIHDRDALLAAASS